MAIVTTSTNLSSISYVEGEIIDIRNGATVTVNSTPVIRPGTIQCLTSGRLLVTNPSTSTAISLLLSDYTKDFIFRADGRMEVVGDMIIVATGTGASLSWTVATPDLTYVESERVAGSGIYYPVLVASADTRFTGSPTTRPQLRGCLATDFESYVLVCLYDQVTNSATIGANGAFIPTGCRVRTPNILIANRDTDKATTTTHSVVIEGAPTGGAFQIDIWNLRTGVSLGTTANIAFNATAATVDAAIEAILGAGTITSSGGPLPATAVSLTQAGAFSVIPLEFRFINSTLSGGTSPIAYDREQADGNMTLLDFGSGGELTAAACMFGSKVLYANSGTGSLSWNKVGYGSSGLSTQNTPTNFLLKDVVITHNPFLQSRTCVVSGVTGLIRFEQVLVLNSGLTAGYSFINCPVDRFNDVEVYSPRTRTSGNVNGIAFTSVSFKTPVRNLHCHGGRMSFANMFGFSLLSPRHSDRTQAGSTTVNATNALSFVNVQNVICSDLRSEGTAACRSSIITADLNCDNFQFYGIDYNCQNNTTSIITYQGSNGTLVDATFRNNPVTSGVSHNPNYLTKGFTVLKALQLSSSNALSVFPANGGVYDLVPVSPLTGTIAANTVGLENYPGGNFVLTSTTASPPTLGCLAFGPISPGTGTVLVGTGYLSGNGQAVLNANDVLTNSLAFACRGITSFTGGTSVFGRWQGGIGVSHFIINSGGLTGGTFTVSVFNSAGTLLGTTPAQPFTVSAATLQIAIRAIPGVNAGATVTGTSLSFGFTLSMVDNVRISANGSLLTGGSLPAYVDFYFNGLATGVPYSQVGPLHTMELRWKLLTDTTWSSWIPLTTANLTAIVLGGSSAAVGINVEHRVMVAAGMTSISGSTINGINVNTNINPAVVVNTNASVNIRGTALGDTYQVRRTSDDVLLYTFTASGVQSFDLGVNFGESVYFTRTNSGGLVLVNKKPEPILLKFGDNGIQDLFYGSQLQVATTTISGGGGSVDLTPVLTAISGVSAQVTNVDADVVGVGSQMTAVQTSVNTANTGITTIITATDTLETGVSATNSTLSGLSLIIIDNNDRLVDLAVDIADVILETQDVNNSVSSVSLQLVGVSGSVGAVSAQITNVPSNVLLAAVEPDVSSGSVTVAQSLRLANAVLGGATTGAGSGTEKFKSLDGTKDRVEAVVSTISGERISITKDLS